MLNTVINELRTARDYIDSTLVTLTGLVGTGTGTTSHARKRPITFVNHGRKLPASTVTSGTRLPMSATTRRKLSIASKRRWAQRKGVAA